MRLCLFASSKSTPTRIGRASIELVIHRHTCIEVRRRKNEKIYVCDFPFALYDRTYDKSHTHTKKIHHPLCGAYTVHTRKRDKCACTTPSFVIVGSIAMWYYNKCYTFECMQLLYTQLVEKKKQQFVGCVYARVHAKNNNKCCYINDATRILNHGNENRFLSK